MTYSMPDTAPSMEQRVAEDACDFRHCSRFGWKRRVIPCSGPGGWKVSPPALRVKRVHTDRQPDDGYSMVELMVTLLVLAILLSIAIPTLIGASGAADDRSAQSNLVTTLTSATTLYQNDGQSYFENGVQDPTAFASALGTLQPSLTFHAGSAGTSTTLGSSGDLSTISVAVSADGNGLVLASYSLPGNCFYLVDNGQALIGTAGTVAPFVGTTAVTTTASAAPVGTVGLPTTAGISYVEMKGDTTKSDCNAYSPRTSGPPATIRYLTSGFPS